MPTANSTSSSTVSSSTGAKQAPQQQRNTDNKIAKAAAKAVDSSVAEKEPLSSATSNQSGGIKTPQEQPEFIKQALIMIEKKVRNLEKRRIKLEEYKESQRKGTELNEDQLSAVSRYDEVLRTLELSKELEKSLVGLANDALKQQKKQAKKEQLEREEAVKEKLKEAQKFLTVLDTFGSESIRNDFLNETNGAFKLSEQELELLDEFNKIVKPASLGSKLESSAAESSEHLVGLIESKNKPISSMTPSITYLELRKLFDRIMSASYWDQEQQSANDATSLAADQQEQISENQQDQQSAEHHEQEINTNQTQPNLNDLGNVESLKSSSASNLNSDTIQHQQHNKLIDDSLNQLHIHDTHQQQHQQQSPIEQGVYHQQNTSEGYVLVSTSASDMSENVQVKLMTSNQQSPTQQHSLNIQQQTKTFFTTLNQVDLPANRNINEFLTRCENNDEGINFLQDSEIQVQRQQASQQGQNPDQLHQQQQSMSNKIQHHHQQEQDQYQQQQQPDNSTSYQPQLAHQQQNNNYNFNSNQDFNQNDQQKDNGFKQQRPQRDNNSRGDNRNYQSKPRYSDERRSGGPPRNNGGSGGAPPPRTSGGPPPFNGGRNSNGGSSGGNVGGYRGGAPNPSGGNNGGNRPGGNNSGYYRGGPNPGNSNSGNRPGNYGGAPRSSTGGNNYQHTNRNQDVQHQQPQMA